MMTFYISKLKLISLITTVSVILLFSLDQTSWAALIICPVAEWSLCNGTPADDIIIGTAPNAQIEGFAGNDYIYGASDGHNYIFADEGNDVLVGGDLNDVLSGGKGDDMYDGLGGDDSIVEDNNPRNHIISNDIISGGLGDDYISAGGGRDAVNGGPGNDQIYLNLFHRDFSVDSVDCGSGTDYVGDLYSGDSETAIYCETVVNNDG